MAWRTFCTAAGDGAAVAVVLLVDNAFSYRVAGAFPSKDTVARD